MAERAAWTSLLVALLVMGLKALAYRLTGSVALLSDALESTVNVVAALLALLAIRFAARPPDATHPFGHTKAEYLSAVLEGVFILLAAFFIAKEALPRLLHPTPLKDLGSCKHLCVRVCV
jgi:Predicted Co/Zn/Cd cation transporters